MDGSVRDVFRIVDSLPEGLSPADAFVVLTDHQRRYLLTLLRQLETPERMSALTRNLAAATGRIGDEEIRRLHIRLYHCHIPKLTEAGIVSYDEDSETVELTDEGWLLMEVIDQ